MLSIFAHWIYKLVVSTLARLYKFTNNARNNLHLTLSLITKNSESTNAYTTPPTLPLVEHFIFGFCLGNKTCIAPVSTVAAKTIFSLVGRVAGETRCSI